MGFKRFEVGKTYKTQGGQSVTIIAASGIPGYETVQGDDPINFEQPGGHRYNRPSSDLGRVTGTAHDWSDPRNLIPERATELELFSSRGSAETVATEDDVRLIIMEARHPKSVCPDDPAEAFGHERVEGRPGFYVTVQTAEFGKLYISRGIAGPDLPDPR